ncbi:hypothetical protein FACS189432_06350 [Bacteroidia bacterium]|nr:hypothetical protein FACS189432_06350 [Bacteroidia bacterium]
MFKSEPGLKKKNPAKSVNLNALNEIENHFSIDLTIEDMTEISSAFQLPFSLQEQTKITGEYSNIQNQFILTATAPKLAAGGTTIEDIRLTLKNSEESARLDIQGANLQKKNDLLKFAVSMDADDDVIKTSLNWGNNSLKYKGNVDFSVLFSKEDQSALQTKIDIRQSALVFNDSVWTLYPATVQIDSSAVLINHIQASHEEQFIKIDGAISQNPNKKISVELNRVDLEYIFKSLNIKSLEFGGMASGFVNAQDIYHTRKLSTHLNVTDFAFNNVIFGDLDLNGDWDDINQGVLMKGLVYKNDSTQVKVDGIIYPVAEEISIDFDAKNTDARFLRKYLDKVIQQLSGSLTGHLHLFGDLNNPTVEGGVFAQNCRFGVEYLNTFYTFTDSVKCLPDEIRIKDVSIYDEKGKAALANGYVKHKLFDDFQFSANVSYENFMVFNANKSMNPLFYGTAYGSGTALLSGTEDLVNIDVSMQNTENTKITLNFMEETDIVDYDFIRFVSPQKDAGTNKTTSKPVVLANTASGTEIRLNLLLNVTPQATLEMIMDPISEDKISGYGTGNMQIQYGTKTPLKVLGNYSIEKGKYNFSFQRVIFRNFDIQEGSSIAFLGDPYTAELNIKANYTVTANLGDLDQQLINQELRQSARNNVPVNCILQLNGLLSHPEISFDLDLPGATVELNRQVKSYIRTEDMMNQQIGYLLVLNRFYTSPEFVRNESRFNNDLSYLTSPLFKQLSNMLGSLSDKFKVDTKFHQTYEGEQTSTEMEFLLSSQLLNNRLIINGNFGYIDNPYLNGGNQKNVPLVGDFDLEYKLTKSGEIRLKGFNHYNYRNYYSMTPKMTQGFGILFRKDFNRFSDFLWKKAYRPPALIPAVSDTITPH